MPRHPNDVIEQPWPGCADKGGDPRFPFVPIERRDLAANVPPDIETRRRRELYGTREIVLVLDAARGRTLTLNPANDADDLEVALRYWKIDWAGRQLEDRRFDAEQARFDAEHYTCSDCRKVIPPGLTGQHVRQRAIPGHRSIHACYDCWKVAEHRAIARLAAEVVEGGQTRGERADQLLERTP